MPYRLMPKRSPNAEKRYEQSGKRPGTPISTRLDETTLAALDEARGETPRSAWLFDLIRRELRFNSPPAAKRKKKGPQ